MPIEASLSGPTAVPVVDVTPPSVNFTIPVGPTASSVTAHNGEAVFELKRYAAFVPMRRPMTTTVYGTGRLNVPVTSICAPVKLIVGWLLKPLGTALNAGCLAASLCVAWRALPERSFHAPTFEPVSVTPVSAR